MYCLGYTLAIRSLIDMEREHIRSLRRTLYNGFGLMLQRHNMVRYYIRRS